MRYILKKIYTKIKIVIKGGTSEDNYILYIKTLIGRGLKLGKNVTIEQNVSN